MATSDGHPSDPHGADAPREFLTTRWSVVRAAAKRESSTTHDPADVHAALTHLCESYWLPLYGYVRRRGHDSDDARDLTQAFFARLLEKRDIDTADPALGRFRAYLLASMKHFLANESERRRALKRGGGDTPISIDARDADTRLGLDPGHELTPEKAFERSWALALLERTLAGLREEYETDGNAELFTELSGTITGLASDGSRREMAERLGMTEGALNVAAHRLRRRYRERLRAEIAETVADRYDVEDELRDLFGALGG